MEDFVIDGKKIAIIGSRVFKPHIVDGSEHCNEYGHSFSTALPNGSYVCDDLSEVYDFVESLPPDVTIISGGAVGVDSAARIASKAFNLKYIEFPAEWKRYGTSAGFIRNYQVVSECDCVVAFWDGKSKGTAHATDYAKKIGRHVIIIRP